MSTQLKLAVLFCVAAWRVDLEAQPLPTLNVGARVRVVAPQTVARPVLLREASCAFPATLRCS